MMAAIRKFSIGSLRFEEGSRVVLRADGSPTRLSFKEYVVMHELCTTGRLRTQITRNAHNLIYRLRKKLGLDAHIVVDWRDGYRLLNVIEEQDTADHGRPA
ncbi:hypothetical protein RA307_30520 [Xanthobacteraceae bacterium Astr-EGSB]|jgi:DNA-binding response OmpR family regulator|uniref:hypothetical protein n=1 Tax=Astrobacterium formosum TaxID=3069710 RepID=UPI0027B4EC32|nr:hypothetical protein [Xanthobacteraceae bacterium Astr-EGSB]